MKPLWESKLTMVSSKFVRVSIQWYLGYKKYVLAVQMRQNNPWQFIRMVFPCNYDDVVFQLESA